MGEVIVYLASDLHPKEHVVLQPDFDSCEFELKAAQSELAALREELERQKHYVEINANSAHGKHKEGQQYKDERDALREDLAAIIANRNDLKQRLTAAEQRNAELKKQLDSIDNHLRGNVNDPDPLPPILPGAFSRTTTYGLVSGLRRERDYLKKCVTPLPAGDDYLRQLAQRLREYVRNPHHVDPISEAFKRLIDDSAFALSKAATALKPTESGASE